MLDVTAANPGPRYVLALYDGGRLVGYVPWSGSKPIIGNPITGEADLYHSEVGVRHSARAKATAFAPLAVVPFDLVSRRPLDPAPVPESAMPLRDEELARANGPTESVAASDHATRSDLAAARHPRDREEMRAVVRQFLLAYHDAVVRIVEMIANSPGA